jgi:hypothetical protein
MGEFLGSTSFLFIDGLDVKMKSIAWTFIDVGSLLGYR